MSNPRHHRLAEIDWDKLRNETVTRLNYLEAISKSLPQNELGIAIGRDLIAPALANLILFIESTDIEEFNDPDEPEEP